MVLLDDERPRLLGQPGPAPLEAGRPSPDEHERVVLRARAAEHAGDVGPVEPAAAAASVAVGLPARAASGRSSDDATATRSTSTPTTSAGARSGRSSPTSASSSSSSAPSSARASASATTGSRSPVGSTVDVGQRHRPVGRGEELLRLLLRERQPERLRQRPRRLPGRHSRSAPRRSGSTSRCASATSPSTSPTSAPAAAMKVVDATGTVVFDQGVPLQWTSERRHAHASARSPCPTPGLTVYVVGAASGEVDPDDQARPDAARGLHVRQRGRRRSPPRS